MYWLMFVLGIAGAALTSPILLLVGRRRRRHRTDEAQLVSPLASEGTHPSMLVDSRARSYLGPHEYALACAYVQQGGSEVSDLYVVLTPRNLWWFRFASMDAEQAAIVWATSLNPIHITTLDVDESAGTTRLVYEGGEIAWRWSRASGARKLMLMLRDLFDPETGIASRARREAKADPPKNILD
jgi:4-amino-4-deoxy-L-arabinose transferase-like glycosyltransferase